MAGSYEKRGNSYRLVYMYKGKKHTRTITLQKGQRIETELQRYVISIQENKSVTSNILFINFAQKWLDEYAKPTLRERTVQGYIDYLNLRLIPYFGNMKLCDIELYNIQLFVNSLKNELNSETIKKYKNCLSGIFNSAIKWGFSKYNPCTGVEIPKGLDTSISPVFLNKSETDVLINKLETEPLKYKIIVKLALQCGMRRSEILALTWNAINFESNTISIFQAVSALKGRGTIISETKNKSSVRTIYVKEDILVLIQELQKVDELIFGYVHADTVTKWFNKFLKKNNFKHMRFHDLRHTHATLLISNNINMKTVSARLGHSTIATTMNIYTHALSEDDKKASLLI